MPLYSLQSFPTCISDLILYNIQHVRVRTWTRGGVKRHSNFTNRETEIIQGQMLTERIKTHVSQLYLRWPKRL